ncbi:MAG TPA: Holliday junction resolvase RuvX [Candidatus Saccharimonadales bacterium]|nr:Holliday junction resolvase RuvX [Candidatus Saccharimonadales bacterium]
MHQAPSTILALDVGMVRIGVARASTVARLAEPLTTLPHTPEIYQEIADLCKEHGARIVVVGLPRGLEGQHTGQTDYVEDFVEELKRQSKLTVVVQDEALTSRKAEAELANRRKAYHREEVDALAATYILEDYLAEHGGDL